MSGEKRISSTPPSQITPKELERLQAVVRAAKIVEEAARLNPPRPAITYSKLREEQTTHHRITSTPQ